MTTEDEIELPEATMQTFMKAVKYMGGFKIVAFVLTLFTF